jgi:xanthosine utilization system XapX-like protein
VIALVGLLGMVFGEYAVDVAKRHLAPPAQVSMREAPGDVRGARWTD